MCFAELVVSDQGRFGVSGRRLGLSVPTPGGVKVLRVPTYGGVVGLCVPTFGGCTMQFFFAPCIVVFLHITSIEPPPPR